MCLAVVALDAHPRYRLVVAANRDEFHIRATAAASWWAEGILAGRDLAAGGTWLGVRRDGRWALLTNVREPGRHDPTAPSRGALVLAALGDPARPAEAVQRLHAQVQGYNGFNLLAGDADTAAWGSNRAPAIAVLRGGVHGLSNALLDTPWPKLTRMREALAAWARTGDTDFAMLWTALADRTLAPDEALPSTGVSLEWERQLSAPFIVGERYGTRCSSVFAIDRDGVARFVERSFDAQARPAGEVAFDFLLEPARGQSERSIT